MSAPTLTRPDGSPAGPSTPRARRLETARSYATVLGMLLALAVIALARPLFIDPRNLAAVAVDATVLIVLAVGLSVLMSMKGLDLSLAATADLAGYLAARALLEGQGALSAVLIGLLVGLGVGVVNGLLSGYLGVPAIVATLGLNLLLSGYLGVPAIVATLGLNLLLTAIALVVSDNGTPQQLFTAPIDLVEPFLVFGSDSWGPIRLLLLAAVLVVALAWFATARTSWGRRIELVDSSARAAHLAGVGVRSTFASGFVVCSLLAAAGGLMLTARTGLAVPGSAQPFLLDAFTAVYLGATASPKGRISVLWTVVGAVFVTLLANGLVLRRRPHPARPRPRSAAPPQQPLIPAPLDPRTVSSPHRPERNSMAFTMDAHNHIGFRHGASQTGEELLQRLDAAGVDRACAFPFVEGVFDNDDVDRAHAAAPDRIIPFLAVNPWQREEAVAEVHRRADKGYRGVKIHPTIHGYHLSDLPLVGPVIEAIRERGLIVICHGASDLYNAPPEFARICRAYPEVPFLMAHSGTFWSHDQAVEVAAETPNLYLETARVPIFEVATSIQRLGPEKVVWGTDSPFVDYTFEYEKMERAAGSEDARQLVCGGNLARLLKMD